MLVKRVIKIDGLRGTTQRRVTGTLWQSSLTIDNKWENVCKQSSTPFINNCCITQYIGIEEINNFVAFKTFEQPKKNKESSWNLCFAFHAKFQNEINKSTRRKHCQYEPKWSFSQEPNNLKLNLMKMSSIRQLIIQPWIFQSRVFLLEFMRNTLALSTFTTFKHFLKLHLSNSWMID